MDMMFCLVVEFKLVNSISFRGIVWLNDAITQKRRTKT
jgi:hypothetical protein